jgi:Na+/melibiose symporter-like transporter
MSDLRHDDERQQTPRPWQPRFGIGTMLLLMLIVCVVGAAASYFVRALQGGRSAQLAFILFTLAAPLLLVVIVSLAQLLFRRR